MGQDECGFILDAGPAPEQVFRVPKSQEWIALLCLIGGIAMLGLAVLGFVVALVVRVDVVGQQVMTTLPAMAGIGALVAASLTWRTPKEVAVGEDGLRIESRGGTRSYRWDEIGWAAVEMTAMGGRRQLKVFDTDGRELLILGDAMDRFQILVDLIAARVAARPDATADRIQLARARRQAIGMAAGGTLFLVVSGFVAWNTSQELRGERLLRTAAVPGQRAIVRRFLAPNGVTPRLEYRVTDANGKSAVRNAEVERAYWDSLEGAATVPIYHVPGEPAFSRLAQGEAPDRDSFKDPAIGYGAPALMTAFSLFFLANSALLWRGYEIDLDSKTGKLSIKCFGSGR
jgi:hypothetical protein